MRICFAGWLGAELDELSQGLFAIDPSTTIVVLGNGCVSDLASFHLPHHRRLYPRSAFEAFNALHGYDLIFYQDYSWDQKENSGEAFPGATRIVEDGRWRHLKATKILHDVESYQPAAEAHYRKIASHFDAVYTQNKSMLDAHRKVVLGLPSVSESYAHLRPAGDRRLFVTMTGSSMNKAYRKQLMDTVEAWSKKRVRKSVFSHGGHGGLPFHGYIGLLWASTVHVCSFSSPHGTLEPIHPKKKHLEATLCGAIPLVEDEGQHLVHDGIPVVAFKGLDQIEGTMDTIDRCQEELGSLVEDGRAKILEQYLHRHEYGRLIELL